MKKLTIVLLSIFFVSCNPFVSKELRRKNKCNRKVSREIKRHDKKIRKIAINCPDILVQDTIRDTVKVEVPKVEIRDSIQFVRDTSEIDSLVRLIKNKKTREVIRKYITEYIPIPDTVIHLSDGYTIKVWSDKGNMHYSVDKPAEDIEIPIETIITTPKPIELTLWEKLMNGAKDSWWIGIIFALSFFIIRIAWRFFSPIK